MINKTVSISIVCVSAVLSFNACSCGNGKTIQASSTSTNDNDFAISHKTSASENLNISILLDLSDRIDPVKNANSSMEYYQRDLGYIESISTAFEKHLKSKPIIRIDDQIQVYFEPEPSDIQINSMAKDLRLSFTKADVTKERIQKISSHFTTVSEKIYQLAIKDKEYIGSDVWSFFKNKVKDYCLKPSHRNILFILTDGYMFHENSKFIEGNKSSYLTPQLVKAFKLHTSQYDELIKEGGYGFVKANDNLSELEVVVLGVNPAKGSPFEGDVINAYWVNWLQDMGVENSMVKLADLPSNLDQVIQRYICE